MASQYDKIETPRELLDEVRVHGLSTLPEDRCRAQDIFGHAAIEELVKLANDTGKDKAGWSTDRRGYRADFYAVLFEIWNWEDATRFWKQYTDYEYNKLREDVAQLKNDVDIYKKQIKALTDKREELVKVQEETEDTVWEVRSRLAIEMERADAAEAEIIKLKAKLYDMMVKGE